MFVDMTFCRNPGLLQTAADLHQQGMIQPDTYVLDLDAIIRNGRVIKEEADKFGIKLYFMTKQLGRNPVVAEALMKLGYDGAVVVDYREADRLWENGIHLGNVGHLVQIPSHKVGEIVARRPNVITVYTVDKAREISQAAVKQGIQQNIMLRVIGNQDVLYPGQHGGFYLNELQVNAREIEILPNIRITGVTSFPCFLYDEKVNDIVATSNTQTLQVAKQLLEEMGIQIREVNIPSATCTRVIKEIADLGGTHGEPGHGLLGTTPLHAATEQPEIPAIVYVSEISHSLDKVSYCYGGGHYRRSHMKHALVGSSFSDMRKVDVESPDVESIDYYLKLNQLADVGATVLFAFRAQVFVTRSEVAVVSGISTDNPKLVGTYDSLGRLLKRGGSV